MGLALLIGDFGFGERWAWKGCHKNCPKTFVLHLQEILLLGCKYNLDAVFTNDTTTRINSFILQIQCPKEQDKELLNASNHILENGWQEGKRNMRLYPNASYPLGVGQSLVISAETTLVGGTTHRRSNATSVKNWPCFFLKDPASDQVRP